MHHFFCKLYVFLFTNAIIEEKREDRKILHFFLIDYLTLFITCSQKSRKLISQRKRRAEESLFHDACGVQNLRVRRVEKRGKRKVTRKGENFSFSWKRDSQRSRKRKRVLPMFVDDLKRYYAREARRSSHSLRLPSWIKFREKEREREREGTTFRRHISTTLPSGLFSRYQSLRIRPPVDLSSSSTNLRETSVPHLVGISYQSRNSRVSGQVSRSSLVTQDSLLNPPTSNRVHVSGNLCCVHVLVIYFLLKIIAFTHVRIF